MYQRVSIFVLFFLVVLFRPGVTQEPDCVDFSRVFPRLIGTQPTEGWATGLSIAGDLGCLAEGTAGISFWDLSDPRHPRPLSRLQTPSHCRGPLVYGDYVYVGHYPGILVIDISDPLQPAVARQVETLRQAEAFLDSDGLLYVAEVGGMSIMDISQPDNPVLVGGKTNYWHNLTIAKAGSLVFIGSAGSLKVYDVSNPANPIQTYSSSDVGEIHGMAVRDDRLFVSSHSDYDFGCDDPCGKFVVMDYSDPLHLEVSGSVYMSSPRAGNSVALLGDRAFIPNHDYGITVIDISDHQDLRVLGHAQTGYSLPSGFNLALKDDVALVGSEWGGFSSYDITGRMADDVTGIPGYPYHMVVEGGFAYLANGDDSFRPPWQDPGLVVVDVSDPENHELVASLSIDDGAWRVAKHGSYLYLPRWSGIRIIDVSDPGQPLDIGNHATTSSSNDAVVLNGYLMVSMGTPSLQVYDLESPEIPELVSSLPLSGHTGNLFHAGDRVYVSQGAGGFSIVDVSDPLNPILEGTTPPTTLSEDVLGVRGDFVYANRGIGLGLFVLDVSDPGDIREITFVQDDEGTMYGPQSLVFQDDLGYLGTHFGVFLLDFSEPSNPEIIRKVPLPYVQTLGLNDGSLVALTLDFTINLGNLYSLPTHCFRTSLVESPPSAGFSFDLGQNHPNPFNPRTTITFELAVPGQVDLAIFDLRGRLTRTLLADEVRPEGAHAVSWDGRDVQGAPAPAGVYFYRLEAGGQIQTKKMVLLK